VALTIKKGFIPKSH